MSRIRSLHPAVAACRPCNRSKGAKPLSEWLRALKSSPRSKFLTAESLGVDDHG